MTDNPAAQATSCIVFFSGGIMSWAAAKRAARRYGADSTTLLFTDTRIEHPDLYRFLHDAAANVGAPLIVLADGRTPWEVFRDEKMIGNTRADPCSKLLKRVPAERWLNAQSCDRNATALVFGIGWEESHRLESVDRQGVRRGVRARYANLGWPIVEAPMCDSPWMKTDDILAWAKLEGLRPSSSYAEGFLHDNCGGFCVKAGESHFRHLLRARPEVYAHHEAEEAAFNAARPGKRRQTVLAPERWVDGKFRRVPMTLREFRLAVESGQQFAQLEFGGCGCFLE